MPVKKFIVGCFDDEKTFFPAVKNTRKRGFKIHDLYTPFPIHGLDQAMGLRDTSLHTAGFIYAITGTTTALSFMSWVFTKDWPLNIGGKPLLPLPAFIPVIFELTVLCSAVGMVLTFCYLCQLAPFVKKDHFHLRATDDLFVMPIEVTERTNIEEVKAFFQEAGAVEIFEKEAETGWWLGNYSSERKMFEKEETVIA